MRKPWFLPRSCDLALLWLGLASPLMAEELKGPAISALFSGNTIAGTYIGGGQFSEYHAVDGRALGDNGFSLNIDACWNVDRDRVCYHYGPMKTRRTYCFKVRVEGDLISLIIPETGALNAIAKAELGNPRAHGDGGRRWSCDDLLAARDRRLARR